MREELELLSTPGVMVWAVADSGPGARVVAGQLWLEASAGLRAGSIGVGSRFWAPGFGHHLPRA